MDSLRVDYAHASRMTSKTVDGVTTTYTYDANGQLLSESRSGYSASYTYDANGNRASRTVNGVTETYTVDSGDKLTQVSVSGVPTKTFGYDGAGRTTSIQTSSGTTRFTYDFESRVTGINYPNSSTNSFAYNGLDTRVGKTDSAGTATFRRMGAGVTAPVLGDGSASFTPGISERRGSTSSFYGADYLGTNSSLYSSTETVSATRQFDAFGNLTSSSGSSANPFGFAGNWGYQNDSDSGLKLLGHRYYDASTGRFLTRDPIKDGRNWYAYCSSEPTSFVDPTGLILWVPVIGAVLVIGAAVVAIGDTVSTATTIAGNINKAQMERVTQGQLGQIADPIKHAELFEASQRRQMQLAIEVGKDLGEMGLDQAYGDMTYGIARSRSHEDLADDLSNSVDEFMSWWGRVMAGKVLFTPY